MTDTPPIGHNRFPGIRPDDLLKIKVEEIPELLELEFPALAKRSAELLEKTKTYGAPADDGALAKLTDLYTQIRDHVADKGEVDSTRIKIKAGPYAAGQAIDAHFNNLRGPLQEWLVTANAWQKSYVRDRDERERRRLQQIADVEAEMARQLLAVARNTHSEGDIERAIVAEASAEKAANATTTTKRTKITSTLGKTISTSTRWTFEVTDIKKLAAAVLAGRIPANCLTYDAGALRAAINGKPPLRNKAGQDDGVRIYEDFNLRRRG